MKRNKFLLKTVLCSIAAITFFSCTTSVPVKVRRPAKLDMQGAQTLAVLPFQTQYVDPTLSQSSMRGIFSNNYSNDKDYRDKEEICSNITYALEASLASTEYYELQNSTRVKVALERGTEIPADAYLYGYISDYQVTDEIQKTDETELEEIVKYRRHVRGRIVYQVINASTNRVISTDYTSFDSYGNVIDANKNRLETPYQIIKSDLNSMVNKIVKQIQPYEETIHLTLLSDKTKNPEMKIADNLANRGYIDQAQQKFEQIYHEDGNFAAGYNSALLLEALGRLDEAKQQMEELVSLTGDRKAINALKNIEYEISQQERLQAQELFR
ncbi:MAG: hypothetical protein J6Y16_06750 [Treponema sp.]|nr:hypothetical protein [Treponema sp.]